VTAITAAFDAGYAGDVQMLQLKISDSPLGASWLFADKAVSRGVSAPIVQRK
jgi:hypothetical protein